MTDADFFTWLKTKQPNGKLTQLQSVAIDGTLSRLKFTFFDNKLVNEDLPQALSINNK